jgi:hypothetical protein
MKQMSFAVSLMMAAGALTGSVFGQLSMPTGFVYTQHGVYGWAPGPALPSFNIPGNGWMSAPGGNMPQVVGGTEVPISTSAFGGMGPWLSWSTAPGAGAQPFFGGAHTTLRGFSNGAAAGLQWGNYFVGDRTPVGVPAGSYNLSGGDIAGTVGPLGWAGRTGIFFPFQVRARKPIGYAALGAAFEIEMYNAASVLQSSYILGAVARTDGGGPGVDGVAAFHVPTFNSPGAVGVGSWRQFNIGPTYYFQGWVGVITPVVTMGPGWSWVLNGRLTLVADPDFELDYFDVFSDPLLTPPTSADIPDLGYNIPTPGGVLLLATGFLFAARRRR